MENNKSRVKILVACHKQDDAIRQSDIYMPIHVGKALHPDLDLGFQGDDTGDNISEKNGAYSELTAMYWAWKNLKDVDYIGLCHYRRYMKFDFSEENLKRTFSKYDIVIPQYVGQFSTNFKELAYLTTLEDTYVFLDTLLGMLPDQRSLIFETFMRSNKFTVCNMFIMRKADFDEYCEFLFTLLGKVEEKIIPNGYSRLKRVMGYLSEPFLGFWIKYKGWKAKQVPMELFNYKGHIYTPFERRMHLLRSTFSVYLENLHYRRHWGDFSCDWLKAGMIQDKLDLKNLELPKSDKN